MNSRLFIRIGFAAALGFGAIPASADGERPLREAASASGSYLLRVEPGRPGREDRPCEAVLLARGGESSAERAVWRRTLVNDVAPLRAFIRDDGRFVITLDEFRRGGARHAVVIYGARGELLRHFLLQDLLQRDDWPHVRTGRRELKWLEGARFAFDDPREQFVITLAWGRTVRIDLRLLAVVNETGTPVTGDFAAIPPEALGELLAASEPGTIPVNPDDAVADAQPPAEDAAASQPVAVEGQPPADGLAQDAAVAALTPATNAPAGQSAGATADASVLAPADATAGLVPQFTAGLEIPTPDPGQKIDYVAWLNNLGVVAGPDAKPLYDQALALFKDTSNETFDIGAAAKGDPNALSSEQLEGWLATNHEALQAFRAAAKCPQKSWEYHTGEGQTMLEVLLPHLAPVRGLAKGCVAEGRYHLAQGAPEEAAACYLDAFAAGAHTGNEPTIISNLVGTAMQALAGEALLDLAADPAAQNMDFALLAAATESTCRPVRSAAEEIQFERAFYLDVAQRLWDMDPDTGDRIFNGELANRVFSLTGDSGNQGGLMHGLAVAGMAMAGFESMVSAGNTYYDKLSAAFAQPYPEARARVTEIETALEKNGPDVHPALRVFAPSLGRYHFVQARGEAQRRAAVLVTQLQAYRQQFGTYPDSLDTFDGREYTVDPYTAGQFTYRRVGEDFVLYSAGGNLADDGGQHDPKGDTNDIVFWPRPPKQ
ncbi:MAG: hypothetical protein AB1716_14010 [Planctomycetota bacterium]